MTEYESLACPPQKKSTFQPINDKYILAAENAIRLALNNYLSVDDISLTRESFKVSPNPFKESTLIEYTLDASKDVSYKLFDINGRLITEEKLGNQASGDHQININRENLPAGVYYFNLVIGNSAITEKLIMTK